MQCGSVNENVELNDPARPAAARPVSPGQGRAGARAARGGRIDVSNRRIVGRVLIRGVLEESLSDAGASGGPVRGVLIRRDVGDEPAGVTEQRRGLARSV